MSIPIWFLDVDGVVNAAGDDLPAHLVATRATTEGISWPIHFDPAVIDAINQIHRDGLAEVRWLTTWGQDAVSSLAPAVGLDEFTAYDMFDSEDWWKAEVVVRSIRTERRPVIWTDDDLDPVDIEALAAAPLPALGIAPPTNVGLSPADLRRVRDFVTIGCRS